MRLSPTAALAFPALLRFVRLELAFRAFSDSALLDSLRKHSGFSDGQLKVHLIYGCKPAIEPADFGGRGCGLWTKVKPDVLLIDRNLLEDFETAHSYLFSLSPKSLKSADLTLDGPVCREVVDKKSKQLLPRVDLKRDPSKPFPPPPPEMAVHPVGTDGMSDKRAEAEVKVLLIVLEQLKKDVTGQILHEFCHWARQLNMDKLGREIGMEFEWDAFKRTLPCPFPTLIERLEKLTPAEQFSGWDRSFGDGWLK
jgi:hypothetical protein